MATAPCEDPLSPLSPIAGFSLPSIPWSTLSRPSIGDDAMLSPYSLPDMLERIYENQLALEAGTYGADIARRKPRQCRGWRQCSRCAEDDRGERRAYQAGVG